ncbi:MAG: hypothetical protein PW786_11370 [Arachidicoccus sp.]|nr:hypothetical protein [Arachidicoccus sp.]
MSIVHLSDKQDRSCFKNKLQEFNTNNMADLVMAATQNKLLSIL